MPTHLTVSIATADTEESLHVARAISDVASLVEYRLDLMDDFHLQRLIEESPVPAIITCRPPRQGGRFVGSERERLSILKQAISFGAAYVDIEWESLTEIEISRGSATRLIGSHHDFNGMIDDWVSTGTLIRAQGADIVKLVGMGNEPDDVLPTLSWLNQLTGPGIGITMGMAGLATRILAPRFPHAFLSFAASVDSTAPGQIEARELVNAYGFKELANANPLIICLTPMEIPWPVIEDYRVALSQYVDSVHKAHFLPLPVESFGPALLEGLKLARPAVIVVLPDVPRSSFLTLGGISVDDSAWRLAGTELTPVFSSLPDPEQFSQFLLHVV